MLVLAIGAASSWTYAVMLGCSSSMAGHLVTNQGNSLVWQMGGATLSIIFLAHLQFGKWGAQHYRLYFWLTCSLASCYTPRGDNK